MRPLSGLTLRPDPSVIQADGQAAVARHVEVLSVSEREARPRVAARLRGGGEVGEYYNGEGGEGGDGEAVSHGFPSCLGVRRGAVNRLTGDRMSPPNHVHVSSNAAVGTAAVWLAGASGWDAMARPSLPKLDRSGRESPVWTAPPAAVYYPTKDIREGNADAKSAVEVASRGGYVLCRLRGFAAVNV